MREKATFLILFVFFAAPIHAQDWRSMTVREMINYRVADDFVSESILDGVYQPYADRVEADQAEAREIKAVVRARQLDPEGTYLLEEKPYRPINVFKSERGFPSRFRE